MVSLGHNGLSFLNSNMKSSFMRFHPHGFHIYSISNNSLYSKLMGPSLLQIALGQWHCVVIRYCLLTWGTCNPIVWEWAGSSFDTVYMTFYHKILHSLTAWHYCLQFSHSSAIWQLSQQPYLWGIYQSLNGYKNFITTFHGLKILQDLILLSIFAYWKFPL